MELNGSATVVGQGKFGSGDSRLFSLAIKTGFLSLLTLGIYRFWAKTRIRQYFWTNTSIDDESFEYTGTGLEKFLGFLIAVVVLAVYLAIVQLVLFQFGLMFVFQPRTEAEIFMQIAVIYLSLFAISPLLFFAQYRSRRYKLARTRFRGLRFGMLGAAGGYVWRGLMYMVLTIVSVGLLWPLMTFRLEKYMTDRSWYGDSKFAQGGRWTGLYGAMKHIIIAMAIMVAVFGIAFWADTPGFLPIGMVVAYIWGLCGYVHYRVQSFAYLTRNKTLGGDIRFQSLPKTGTVLAKIILGSLLLGILAGVVGGLFFMLVAKGLQAAASPQIAVIGVAIAYLVLLVFASALSLMLITEPIIMHVISETRVENMGAFAAIRQRVTDKGADAEGFADALDWGGAI